MRKPPRVTFDPAQLVVFVAVCYLLYRVGGATAFGLFCMSMAIAWAISIAVAVWMYYRR
jgi:hypothetical protein